MKKWWLLILIPALLAAAFLVFFPSLRGLIPAAGRGVVEAVSIPRTRERDPAGLIPARAGLVIRVRSAEDLWKNLTAGRAFRELEESPLWMEEKVEERLAAAREAFEEGAGFRLDRSRIMQAAGRDIVAAVIPAGEGRADALMAASRLGPRARLTEIVLRLGDSLKDEPDRILREEIYRGERVVRILPSEAFPFEAAYAVIDDCLVAAVSDSARLLVEEAIDLALGAGGSLIYHREYNAALEGTRFAGERFLEFYLEPGRFPGGLAAGLPPGPPAETAEWVEFFIRSLDPGRTIGLWAGYREGVYFRFRSGPTGVPAEIPDPAPVTRVRLPAGEMLYAFFIADPDLFREDLAARLVSLGVEEEPGFFPGLGGWERESSIDIRRDILPALGEEWSLVLGGLTGEEFLPLPPAALVNRVADREAARAALDRVTAWAVLARGLSPAREVHSGVELTYFPGLLFAEPGYAFAGDELIVAGSRPLLRRVIDLRAGHEPELEDDPLFRRTVSILPPEPEGLGYLEGEVFFRSVRAAADWYFAYQRLVPEEPVIPEELYLRYLTPSLDLLRFVRSAGIAFGRNKSVVNIDGFLYIPGSD